MYSNLKMESHSIGCSNVIYYRPNWDGIKEVDINFQPISFDI